MSNQPKKIIFEEGSSWFFWDNTWKNKKGPFTSQLEAEWALFSELKKCEKMNVLKDFKDMRMRSG